MGNGKLGPAEDLAHGGNVKAQGEGDEGFGRGGRADAAEDGQVDGGEQVAGLIVNQSLVSQNNLLPALSDKGKTGLIGDAGRRGGANTPDEREAGNGSMQFLLAAKQSVNAAAEGSAEFSGLLHLFLRVQARSREGKQNDASATESGNYLAESGYLESGELSRL
jgi:hypothetical protein